MSPRARRAAVYARLSVTTEESVSIARQVEACERYAAARGWDVVLVATDDGVSATSRRPQDRPGWGAILASPERFEAVIVWKVDRLARRVIDFLTADAALQERGAALVAVEDPIDLTTAQGRAFATMLAVFGELEAASISARVKGARAHLAREGRAVGARPWPFESVPNPDGPGLVWRPIPERAQAVREAVVGITSGSLTLRGVARDWTERGFEPPRGGPSWSPQSVRQILTNPAVSGATPSADGVLRNADGTIRRDPARAIVSPAAQAAVVDVFTSRRLAGGHPVHDLPLLYGLAVCDACGSRLTVRRPTGQPSVYRCDSRDCPEPPSVLAEPFEALVVERFLLEAPARPVEAWIDSRDTSHLDDLHEALAAVQEALVAASEPDTEAALLARRRALREAIAEAESAPSAERREIQGVTLLDLWIASDTTAERRDLLAGVIESARLRRTRERGRGARVDKRVHIGLRG